MSRTAQLAVAVLAVHLLWVGARLPGKVVARRLEDIAAYRSRGAAPFHLGPPHRHGGRALQRLLEATPPDRVLLWRGPWKGAMEFVPGLIAPRLLVHAAHCRPPATTWRGRPLATLPAADDADRPPVAVVVAEPDGSGIRIETR